jgi:TRAP-type C4-dicarboxylate transport system substrate-binding protein
MQWQGKTKFVTDIKLADSTGAFLMSKKEFDKLSPADQQVLKETARDFSKKLIAVTRADNEKSVTAIKKQGLQYVTVDPKELDNMRAISSRVWDKLTGVLYSPELLSEAKKYVGEVRK